MLIDTDKWKNEILNPDLLVHIVKESVVCECVHVCIVQYLRMYH